MSSRRDKDFSKQFAAIYRALASAVPAGSVIDGERVRRVSYIDVREDNDAKDVIQKG